MNNSLKARIRRVEEIAKAEGKTIAFIWGKPEESEGEAIRRMEAEGKNVVFIMWLGEEEGENHGPQGPIDPLPESLGNAHSIVPREPILNDATESKGITPPEERSPVLEQNMSLIDREIRAEIEVLKKHGVSDQAIKEILEETAPGNDLLSLLGGKGGKFKIDEC